LSLERERRPLYRQPPFPSIVGHSIAWLVCFRVRKLILKNFLSPGDMLMLTAAVRDLHMTYPGQYLTDVRTSCEAVWDHNPYLTPLSEDDPDVESILCEYPLIHQSNQLPYHFIHAFRLFLNDRLGVNIQPHAFK